MRYFEVTAADTSVMSHIREHGEKFVQPMHPHFSRLFTYHIGLRGHTKKLQLACAHRL